MDEQQKIGILGQDRRIYSILFEILVSRKRRMDPHIFTSEGKTFLFGMAFALALFPFTVIPPYRPPNQTNKQKTPKFYII